jgi:hypothetical protein
LGHFPKDCWFRKKYPRKRKHHASTVEDDESKRKQKIPSNEKENRKEYYLVSALSNSFFTGLKTLLRTKHQYSIEKLQERYSTP